MKKDIIMIIILIVLVLMSLVQATQIMAIKAKVSLIDFNNQIGNGGVGSVAAAGEAPSDSAGLPELSKEAPALTGNCG